MDRTFVLLTTSPSLGHTIKPESYEEEVQETHEASEEAGVCASQAPTELYNSHDAPP